MHKTWQGLLALALLASAQPTAPRLDYQVFKTRVQPVFLLKRPGHARCYVCHSAGTSFRLQRLSPGAKEWNDEQSRSNFDVVQRLVVPGKPLESRLLTHALSPEAGGDAFHSGGKHWDSQTDPEWKGMADWVLGK